MPSILDNQFRELFHTVQTAGIFPDSKTFCDALPLRPLDKILADFKSGIQSGGVDLKAFVAANFKTEQSPASVSTGASTAEAHVAKLWPYLRRNDAQATTLAESTKIPLPYPYIVPGGRFGEIYYWDSYFTMQGMEEQEDVRGMLLNFSWMIEEFGFIPNGNRQYFLSRSQPPFFGLMLDFYCTRFHTEPEERMLKALALEFDFWNKGDSITPGHAVRLPEGILNRYYDNDPRPRPESYREDLHLGEKSGNAAKLYGNLRAACESGWDFSSRWMAQPPDLGSTACAEILPCDLNALMIFNAGLLAKYYPGVQHWQEEYKRRLAVFDAFFWDADKGFYCDYHFGQKTRTGIPTAAMMFPLFLNLTSPYQAAATAAYFEKHLLQAGGVVTTLNESGQQWDWPNGWAPLQFTAVRGLLNYGYNDLALETARRWTALVEKTYAKTGKMMEKYNVVDPDAPGGGGEYENQDGFGWTNGVYAELKRLTG